MVQGSQELFVGASSLRGRPSDNDFSQHNPCFVVKVLTGQIISVAAEGRARAHAEASTPSLLPSTGCLNTDFVLKEEERRRLIKQ